MDQMNAETIITEHSESLRIAFAQARKELGDDLIFLMYDHQGQPALIAYEKDVALSLVPNHIQAIIEVPADLGCVWVLVYTVSEVTAAQFIIEPEAEDSPE